MFSDAVLTKPRHFQFIQSIAPNARLCTTLDEIAAGGGHLISYGTGVIVPADILARWRWRYNFHGAPPSYPGRDPHHWACYDGARTYGATAHVMTPSVDAGDIVGTLTFGVPKDCTPAMYLDHGERASRMLAAALMPLMLGCGVPPNGEIWSGTKRRRADVLALIATEPRGNLERYQRQEAFSSFSIPSTRSPQYRRTRSSER